MFFQQLILQYKMQHHLVTLLALKTPVVFRGMKTGSEKIAKEAAKTITSNITKPFGELYSHNYYLPLPTGGYTHNTRFVPGALITQVGENATLPREKPITLTNGKFLAETAAVARPDLTKKISSGTSDHCTNVISSSETSSSIVGTENTVPFNFTNVTGKIMGYKSRNVLDKFHHVVTPNSPHVIQGKESLAYFCSYFKNIPLSQIRNDPLFIAYYDQACQNNPSIFTRAFQLALEVSYSKRHFIEQDIDNYFNGFLSINDIVGLNQGAVDISTVYTILQVMHMKDHHGFPSEIGIQIIPTTIRAHKGNMENLSSTANIFIAESKAATGNTTADVILGSHIYDFKPKVDGYNSNHIIFLDYSETNVFAKGRTYLNNLHKNLEILTSTGDPEAETYIKLCKTELKLIIENSNMNTLQKIELWNQYVYHTWAKRPPRVYLPILIPTTKEEFVAKTSMAEQIKEITLPTSKTLDPVVVLGSLKTMLNNSDEETQDKAWVATKGVLGKQKPIDLNINMNKEEVD